MTNQTNWTVFTNSEEQIAEIGMSVYANGFITKNESGIESNVVCSDTTHYWIIPDDPLREMKIRWAQTGQPVWIRKEIENEYFYWLPTTTPDWNIPNAEYSFTEFKEEV